MATEAQKKQQREVRAPSWRPEGCRVQTLMAQAELMSAPSPDAPPSHEVIAPRDRSLPFIFSSPHSGDDYPAAFVAGSRLSPLELRRSEDSFVDELFSAAPEEGAPLLRALFPRAYVDPNREPFELDQAMFADQLPDYANTTSPRVMAGLGTIAKIVASGAEIYREKLTFSEASTRIRQHYWPYHATLRQLVEDTRSRFGFCVLIDCHSMPSQLTIAKTTRDIAKVRGNGRNGARGLPQECQDQRTVAGSGMDRILGDSHGRACAGCLTDAAEASLRAMGYRVGRNDPYSGGFVTRHYGRPIERVHALQIDINRRIYMDETRIEQHHDLSKLQDDLRHLINDLAAVAFQELCL
mgnify:CR=1 FL=1